MGHHAVAELNGGTKNRFLIIHKICSVRILRVFFFFARIFSKTSDVTFPICFDVERSDTKSDFDPS